jgi:hypothetical protein
LKGQRKSYLLRINEDLWNELNKWSEQEFRSLNGQIELILQRAVEERRKGRPPARGENESGKPDGFTEQNETSKNGD